MESDQVGPARIVGVYNADGGVAGELRYVAGHLIGRAHCSLCDVTHSPVRRKRQWDEMVQTLPMEFALLHRNELSPKLQSYVSGHALPLVVLERDAEVSVLLTDEQISRCGGDVDAFESALRAVLPR